MKSTSTTNRIEMLEAYSIVKSVGFKHSFSYFMDLVVPIVIQTSMVSTIYFTDNVGWYVYTALMLSVMWTVVFFKIKSYVKWCNASNAREDGLYEVNKTLRTMYHEVRDLCETKDKIIHLLRKDKL